MDRIWDWWVSNQEKIDYFLNFFRHIDKVSSFIDESNIEWTEANERYLYIEEGFTHLKSKKWHGILCQEGKAKISAS